MRCFIIIKDKKIFLNRARSGFKNIYFLPYDLLYLKSYLRKYRIDSYIFDREAKENTFSDLNEDLILLKNTLFKYNPDVIGISAISGAALDAKFIIKHICQWISDKTIVVSGNHFAALPYEGINYGSDYVIQGEGEISIVELLTQENLPKPLIIKGKIEHRYELHLGNSSLVDYGNHLYLNLLSSSSV